MADEFAVDHGFVSYKFYWIQYTRFNLPLWKC